MPLNLASPGIVVREVDLTLGRVDPVSDKVAAVVAPFAQGPVEVPTLVENESDLLANFGKSYEADRHYEHWLVASSYLAYGGSLRVVRADDTDLKNAFFGSTTTAPKIKSLDHYEDLGYSDNIISGVTFAARNPGSWGNSMKVAIIDGRADQTINGITTTGISVGMGVSQSVPDNTVVASAGSTAVLDGSFKGIITGVGTDSIDIKFVQHVSAAGIVTLREYQENGTYRLTNPSTKDLVVYNNSGVAVTTITTNSTPTDWFDAQKIELTGSEIFWNQLAPRPGTSEFAAARGSRFDEVHIVAIDDSGEITGNPGTILEKHLNLSKAKDSVFENGSVSYYREFVRSGSGYIFAGGAPEGTVATDFKVGAAIGNGFVKVTDIAWDQNASGISFAGYGNTTATMAGGKNYGGNSGLTTTGSLKASVSKLNAGYELLNNPDEYAVDFILQGSGNYTKEEAQAVGLKAIDVAERRKDSIAFLSPYRAALFNDGATEAVVRDSETITDNVIGHFSPITSSSFAIFDSGYKYMYDRFSDKFRYVPLNGDIAGTCARTDINDFPWFSPAGTQRGAILNAVKLPYNPNKTQRDRLYSNRINPVTFIPGSGIVLFGDKTGLAKASAFDRINVRRLFLYLEKAISAVARDQLFEFNDEITRTNFVNSVEPFLREVQSNRGVQDFVVVCDETNNTAAVIDRNEFVADIYIKPARSINFVGLTFVATRTGVSFEEIIGNV
ncbi:tail sheath [Synechococcus phage S-T4]|jgi:hypothetical protein|uniref:Tail sheath monomer n=1 Tax=Synechococcus phage S-T4 TaxID=2268578 RepID=A0A385EFC1_9CAUD|nr:tail sheath [Synechococcus phage S-T4]AXQ70581.1 tail sheath monomer [Synechococcus phage S-T4]